MATQTAQVIMNSRKKLIFLTPYKLAFEKSVRNKFKRTQNINSVFEHLRIFFGTEMRTEKELISEFVNSRRILLEFSVLPAAHLHRAVLSSKARMKLHQIYKARTQVISVLMLSIESEKRLYAGQQLRPKLSMNYISVCYQSHLCY